MSRDQSGEFVCGYWGLKGQYYQHASLCTSVWEGGKCYIGYQHTHINEEVLFAKSVSNISTCILISNVSAARLAQLGECRSAERESVDSNPGRTNTQGL